jgi:hypothetical protein
MAGNNRDLNVYQITLGVLQLKLKFRIPDKPNYTNYPQQHYSLTLLLILTQQTIQQIARQEFEWNVQNQLVESVLLFHMIPVTTHPPTQSYTCAISYSANPHCKSLAVPDM